MPFRSAKQRRYLWANEPKIARDWTNKYGSRVKKYDGGTLQNMQSYAMPAWNFAKGIYGNQNPTITDSMRQDLIERAEAKGGNTGTLGYEDYGLNTSTSGGRFAGGITDIINDPHAFANAASLGRVSFDRDPETGEYSFGDTKYDFNIDPSAKGLGANILRGINEGGLKNVAKKGWDAIKNEFSGSAEAAIPDNKIKDTQYDWEGNFRGSNRPGWWGKSYDPVKYNQMKDIIDRYNNPRVAEDTSDLSGMAEVQTPRPLGFDTSYGVANEADVAQKPLTQKKGLWDSITGGITNVLDNTMIGKIAAMNNALNPRAWNYNPALQGQIDFMKDQGRYGVMDASGLNKITGGVLQGKGLQSFFGSNDLGKMYDKSIAQTKKVVNNIEFGKQWSRLKKDNPDEYYKKLAFHQNKLKQKEREKKAADIAARADLDKRKAASKANWQQDYSTWTSPSGRDHATTGGIGSPESKKGPAGGSIGASRFLARGGRASYFNGGLASLWPR